MDTDDFDGTLVLEQLASYGLDDAFLDAVDADDFRLAKRLMQSARLDAKTISIVLAKMAAADDEH